MLLKTGQGITCSFILSKFRNNMKVVNYNKLYNELCNISSDTQIRSQKHKHISHIIVRQTFLKLILYHNNVEHIKICDK